MTQDSPRPPSRTADLRRELRVPYRLPVTLLRGREEIPLVTQDVSHHGLFLAIDDLPSVRHLVRLRLLLPPYRRELVAHGMVVHNVGGGVGVQLYGLDRSARTVWSNFVTRAQEGELRGDEVEVEDAIRFMEPEIVEP